MMKDECSTRVERMILSHKGMTSLLGRDESAVGLVERIRIMKETKNKRGNIYAREIT